MRASVWYCDGDGEGRGRKLLGLTMPKVVKITVRSSEKAS
jgi:hypothetical protein